VSYIPGARFYAGNGGRHELRLAFSMLSEADLIEGTRRLSKVLRDAL
jgi:DNA-binding transcriptional MocR family regulator